jgi:DNA-directed RNA polymerase subunit alpha
LIKNEEKKERIVTAGDFQKNSEVEIKNPELYLFTLAPESTLEIKIYCQKNWDYHQAEEQKEKYFPEDDDIIALDTDYSPVKGGQVSFQVKSVIIGIEKDEEELTLTIITDGAIKPKKALEKALEISYSSFNSINKSINNSSKKEEKLIKEN